MNRRFPLLFVFLFGCAMRAPSLGQSQVYRNREYGIEATFPSNLIVCEVLSWEHPKGFFAWLDRPTDCSADTESISRRRISVFADYNSGLQSSPLENVQPCLSENDTSIDFSAFHIDNLPTGVCVRRGDDGAIELIAYAGSSIFDADTRVPRTFFYARLVTERGHYLEDADTFRRFLLGLRIDPTAAYN